MPPIMASSIRSKDEIDFCLVAGFVDAKSNTGVVFVAVANRLVVLVVAVVAVVYWDDGVLLRKAWEFGNVNAFVWWTADRIRNVAMSFIMNTGFSFWLWLWRWIWIIVSWCNMM